MTSYISFTPISGAKNEDPLCYLLELDDVNVLLDCGWSDTFDTEQLKGLKRVAKQVDLLLLSHSDLNHLGAYTYAYTHLDLKCPAYATVPVHDMGKLCMIDIYQSKRDEMDFNTFTREDIDSSFDAVNRLRYSQPAYLTGKCGGITITAYAAGHTMGGTIWKIKKDTDEIIYAVDYNHRKERHLDGTVLHSGGVVLDPLSRPSLMITDAYNSTIIHPPRKHRDAAIFESITETLQRAGSVLLPTDSASRVLELTYLLDQHWGDYNLTAYPLILLSNQSSEAIKFAKSMLEWMGDAITQQFSSNRESPFEFKNLKLLQRRSDLEKFPGPKVVVASNSSLETGFAREIFLEWTNNTTETDQVNTLILTDRGSPGSLTRHMYDLWDVASAVHTDQHVKPAIEINCTLNLTIRKKVPLQGQELVEYQAEQKAKAEREAAQAVQMARNKTVMDEDDFASDTSESEPGDLDMEELLSNQFDVYVRDATKSGGFFKQNQSFKMFPYVERKRRFDDYGEIIQPEHYMKGLDIDVYGSSQVVPNLDEIDEGMDLDKPSLLRDANDLVPTKYVAFDVDQKIKTMVRYVDLEGLSDGRSIKTILPQVAPRKLILIHGSEEATKDLEQFCLNNEQMTKEIFTPSVGEELNLSKATNVYQVKLTDALVSSLKMKNMDDYQLAHISGRIHFPPDTTTPTLDLPAPEDQGKWHAPVFVGDIRLTNLKQVLQAEGISAEFKGEGVLVCNEQVVVRKMGTGQLLLEGNFCDDYFKIREIVYGQHAIL